MSTWIDGREADDPAKIERNLALYRESKANGTSRVAEHDDDDDRFGLWLALVDRRITRAVGVSLFDLEDWDMRSAYDAGSSPREAAIQALESDDLYSSWMTEALGGE